MIRPSLVLLVALVAVTAASQPPENANTCQACRSAVSFARQLNSSTHRQEYKDVVEKFCEQYYQASTDYQTGPCPMFTDGFFFILDHTDPVTHCDEIGACGSTQLPSDDIYEYLRPVNVDNGVSLQGADGPVCEYCIQLLEQVKASLSNPNTVKEIKERADAFCEFLVVVNEDKPCKEVIDKYLDLAVSYIGYLDSRQYCRSISMCPKKRTGLIDVKLERQLPTLADFNNFGIETSVAIGSRAMNRAPSTGRKASGECAFCKTIVKEMFKFVKDNKTEASIVEALNKVCRIIYPQNRQGFEQCEGLVKAYTKELVELLIDETDPDMICTLLGLCVVESKPRIAQVESTNLDNLISYMDKSVKQGSARSCIECKVFISYLKTEIVKPNSEEQVKQWLMTKLCRSLPTAELKNACKTMVDTYAPVFFRAIAGDLDPTTACVQLGACKKLQRVHVLDLASSSWVAPSYMSRAHDQGCNRCVDIVVRIDDYLSNHSPGQDISTLTRVCGNFPGSKMRRQCNNMIRENGLDIIQMIPNMENPRQLCRQIKEC